MSSTKPVIVLVNGSFSPSPMYAVVVDRLSEAGYKVKVADYPSIYKRDPLPPATMTDDASHVHNLVEKFADHGHDVLVVAHSYGGIPGSESIKGLSKSARQSDGKKGGVIGILYVAALTPKVGGSLLDSMADGGDGTPEFLHVDGDYMYLEPEGNAKVNFSDMEYEEALPWAKIMPNHSSVSFTTPLTYAGYKDVPVTYLFTENDPVVPPAMQQASIRNMEEAIGGNIEIVKLDSGHFPFITRPADTTRIILQVAEKLAS